MFPWAVQNFPPLWPAHALAFGPVNAAYSPFAFITANWRPCFVQSWGLWIRILLPDLLDDLRGRSVVRSIAMAWGP